MKKTIKKKTNYINSINLRNPFHWWGLIFLIIGVTGGGAIGGGLGALCGIYIFKTGNNKEYSTIKKIGISFLITLGGIVGYIVLASFLISLF